MRVLLLDANNHFWLGKPQGLATISLTIPNLRDLRLRLPPRVPRSRNLECEGRNLRFEEETRLMRRQMQEDMERWKLLMFYLNSGRGLDFQLQKFSVCSLYKGDIYGFVQTVEEVEAGDVLQIDQRDVEEAVGDETDGQGTKLKSRSFFIVKVVKEEETEEGLENASIYIERLKSAKESCNGESKRLPMANSAEQPV
ncbi:hypothetical protein NL676_028590 [Syzygium grande]|nr:hypothetical protein NL676_028590 [Syzygium grande]